MVSKIFLGMSLLGAEWVLYLLILLSIVSVAFILERVFFYRTATQGLTALRESIRAALQNGQIDAALQPLKNRVQTMQAGALDLESSVALAILTHTKSNPENGSPQILEKIGEDAILRQRIHWEKNLSGLATIGSNAPFIGLFGTVLGIIKAFHDLSQQIATGIQTVTAGIAEALIATAIGILVAIPAVVAFNLFQRRVKAALAEAEALKSFIIGKLGK